MRCMRLLPLDMSLDFMGKIRAEIGKPGCLGGGRWLLRLSDWMSSLEE